MALKRKIGETQASRMARQRLEDTKQKITSETVVKIPVEKLVENNFNSEIPVEDLNELAESIREVGLMNPVLVYAREDGSYEIISGHRRVRAMRDILNLSEIPCIKKKYPPDVRTRFREHADANVQTRKNDVRFWQAEIRIARDILHDEGFSGTKDEEVAEISSMLGKGASKMQIYRYDGLKKLSEEVLALDRYGLSPNTLYNAVGLDSQEQRLLAEKVSALMDAAEDPSMSRAEFNTVVHSIKELRKGKRQDLTKKEKADETRTPYESQLIKSSETFLKRLMKARSEEEKKAALQELRSLRIRLDEAEKKLTGGQ